MPNSVLWVCLVAIWLFVLVPMVIKGRPEVRKTTETTLATRVINRGGRAMSKATGRVSRGRHPHDTEWVAPVREYRKPGELINELDDHEDVLDDEVIESDDQDPSVDDTAEADGVAAGTDSGAMDDSDVDSVDDGVELHDTDLDDTDLDDTDMGDTGRDDGVSDAVVDDDYEVLSEPLVDDDGPTRRGRGGYDPSVDTRRSETRYRRRQRVLLALTVVALAAIGAGVMVGGVGWAVTGVGAVLLVGYLAYLRRTVRIEERIRRQRSARAARAERGLRRRRDIDDGPLRDEVPDHLIRPGAVVLEIDDEHPVFDHLPPFQRRRVMREEPEFRRAVGE